MSAFSNRFLTLGLAFFVAFAPASMPLQSAAQSTDLPRGVPYLTIRDKTGDTGLDTYYGHARSTLKAGWCGIDQTSFDGLKPLIDAAPFRIPDEIMRVERIVETDIEATLDQLEITSDGKPLLFYVHGFFIDFEKGCRRATLLQENIEQQGRFIWFSWPSDGLLLNYSRDEADVYWSVPHIADTITTMEQRFGGDRVNLVGHSLGARGLVLALNDLAIRDPDLRLGHIALLAPDIDFQIFQELLPRIRPIIQSITIFVADADRPLAVSAQFHGYPRLGQTGNNASSLEGAEVIDLSALRVRSPTGHLYHVYNSEVGVDLDQLINENKMAAQRRNLVQVEGNLWTLNRAD